VAAEPIASQTRIKKKPPELWRGHTNFIIMLPIGRVTFTEQAYFFRLNETAVNNVSVLVWM
jgi:hypothetical protein